MSRLRKVLVALVAVCPVCLGYWVGSREVRAAAAEVARLGREFGNVPESHPPGFYRSLSQPAGLLRGVTAEEAHPTDAATFAYGRIPTP